MFRPLKYPTRWQMNLVFTVQQTQVNVLFSVGNKAFVVVVHMETMDT